MIVSQVLERQAVREKKFTQNKAAQSVIISHFSKLKGLPTKAQKYTAGDNLLQQKIQFDKVMAKHKEKES